MDSSRYILAFTCALRDPFGWREKNANVTKSPKVIPKFPAATLPRKRWKTLHKHSGKAKKIYITEKKTHSENTEIIPFVFYFFFLFCSLSLYLGVEPIQHFAKPFIFAMHWVCTTFVRRCLLKLQIRFEPHCYFRFAMFYG